MSKPQEKEKPEAKPEEKKPSTEEVLAELVKSHEDTKRSISTLAEAIVKLNEKIEAKGTSGGGGGGGAVDIVRELAKLAGGGGGNPLQSLRESAKAFAETADALDRYRHPSRLGIGEALLMRLGMRSAYPRYMTKTEIEKMEKAAGVWEVLEGGEEEHVTE